MVSFETTPTNTPLAIALSATKQKVSPETVRDSHAQIVAEMKSSMLDKIILVVCDFQNPSSRITKDTMPENTLILDRTALQTLYSPSLVSLPQFLLAGILICTSPQSKTNLATDMK